MQTLRPLAVLLAGGLTLAALAAPAQETTLPGEAIRRATEPTLGERLQDAAEQARDAAEDVIDSTTSAAREAVDGGDTAPDTITATGLDGRAFHLGGDTVLSSAVLGQPVMTSDGVEAGTVRDLILSMDGRLDGIVLNTGVLGVGGRNVAIGADRLMFSDVVAGVPRLAVSATKAALDTTPDFAPGPAR